MYSFIHYVKLIIDIIKDYVLIKTFKTIDKYNTWSIMILVEILK